MGLGVAHDQDSDGGQGAYARDHEPVTPTEFEDEYSEDGLEHWNDEIAEIEEQLQLNDEIAEELEKRKNDCLRARKRQRRETAEADSEATWKLEQQQQTPEQLQAEEDKLPTSGWTVGKIREWLEGFGIPPDELRRANKTKLLAS